MTLTDILSDPRKATHNTYITLIRERTVEFHPAYKTNARKFYFETARGKTSLLD